jgi:hypothetical protein
MGRTNQGLNPTRDKRFFSFSEMSRPALGPTQPPVQWVPGFLPCGKLARAWFDHSPPSTAWIKNEWSYAFTSPICLHGLERWNFTLQWITSKISGLTDQKSCHIILPCSHERCLISWKQTYHKEKHRSRLNASNGFYIIVAHLKYLECFQKYWLAPGNSFLLQYMYDLLCVLVMQYVCSASYIPEKMLSPFKKMIGQVFLASVHMILLAVCRSMIFEKGLHVFEYCLLLFQL